MAKESVFIRIKNHWPAASGIVLLLWTPVDKLLQWAEHFEFVQHHWPEGVTSITPLPFLYWFLPLVGVVFLIWDHLWFRKRSRAMENAPARLGEYASDISIQAGWPRLTDDSRLLISEILAAGNRAGKVEIVYSTDDGAKFGKDLAECLREQRWEVSALRGSMPRIFFEGIQLRTVSDSEEYGIVEYSGVQILAKALRALKFRTILVTRGGVYRDTTVEIAIGHWVENT